MPKKHEVLTIHIGQPGVQIGSAIWELFCLEHGIYSDGYLYQVSEWFDDYDAIFSYNDKGKFSPRSLMIDLEPSVVDEIRVGAYQKLFAPELLITGKEDAASNYARAYFKLGHELIGEAIEKVRCLAENCPLLQGVLVFRGTGGGTGSGFADLLEEHLADEFKKKFLINFAICPSPQIATNTVETYNTVLTTHASLPFENVSVLMQNQSIYRMLDILQAPHPTFTNVNRLIAQVVSAITASVRFEGPLNTDIMDLVTNLLPFPRIHFPLVSYAPLLSSQVRRTALQETPSTLQIATECFDESNHFLMCDMDQGRYLSCAMFSRGDVRSTDINYVIHLIKKHKILNFVEWCPTGFKIAVSYQPPTTIPAGDLAATSRAVCMLINSSAVVQVWESLLNKFDTLFKSKAFLHHYLNEGLEEAQFTESANTVSSLIEDYKNTEK